LRSLRVRKPTQGLLLAVYSAVLLTLTLLVQGGHGVKTNLAPFDDIKRIVARARSGDVLSNAFVFALVGIAGNLLLFAIWGFLAWKFLDESKRSPLRNHLEVVFIGALLSIGIETAQVFLPTRAADVNDVFWNVLGTMAGSVIAHLDRNLKLEWE
jgi:glycopeptide antibiotics resistance protein